MTLEELLEECFGSADWPLSDVVLQVRSGDDVLAHLDLYWRVVGVGSTEFRSQPSARSRPIPHTVASGSRARSSGPHTG